MTITADTPATEATAAAPIMCVASADLAWAINATLPHAAKDSDALPILAAVRLEWDGTTLTLVATDRYSLAVIELDGTDSDPLGSVAMPAEAFSMTLGRADAADLAKRLKVRDTRATLTAYAETGQPYTPASLRVEQAWGDWGVTYRSVDGEYPKFRALVPSESDLALPADVEEGIGFSPANLVKLGKLADRGAALRFRFRGPNKPVKVTTMHGETRVVVMLMPVRLSS